MIPKTRAVEVKETQQTAAVNGESTQPTSIHLYTIENNNGAKMIVSDYGAAVVSLFVPDRNGKLQDVVLGYENLDDYIADEFYMGTIVGRYANRISGDTVVIENTPYKLYTKDGGYHLHGGREGFNKKSYLVKEFKNNTSSGIIFFYKSPHLEEGFPGELSLEVTYTFSDDHTWTVEYKAVSDKTTIINLTQHTYFNLGGDPSKNIDGHELSIHAAYYLPVNELQVPTGILSPVKGTVFDFASFKNIGEDIHQHDKQLILSNGYDHSFVLEQKHMPALKPAASACDPVSGIKMEVFTTEPAVHFYSGNFLENIKGKKNISYQKRAGFCLETQHFPDAPKHNHFPQTVLKAGEEFYSKTVFKFSL